MPKVDKMSACSLGAARALPDCGDNICSLKASRCHLKMHVLGAQKVDKKVLVVENSSPFAYSHGVAQQIQIVLVHVAPNQREQ